MHWKSICSALPSWYFKLISFHSWGSEMGKPQAETSLCGRSGGGPGRRGLGGQGSEEPDKPASGQAWGQDVARAGPHRLTLLLFSDEHAVFFIFIFTKNRNVSSQNVWKTEKHRQAKNKSDLFSQLYFCAHGGRFPPLMWNQAGISLSGVLQPALTMTIPTTGAGSHLHRRMAFELWDRTQ